MKCLLGCRKEEDMNDFRYCKTSGGAEESHKTADKVADLRVVY